VDLDLFIELLADRLSRIVPAGFHVQAEDGILWYSSEQGDLPGRTGNYSAGRSGTYVRDNFSLHGTTGEEHMTGVAVQALDELQDYVSEATSEPWPGTGSQPRPHARIGGSHLELWYGNPDDPALACESIPLSGLDLT
jgi:hypothetical protein